jgi:hypothetical protein
VFNVENFLGHLDTIFERVFSGDEYLSFLEDNVTDV